MEFRIMDKNFNTVKIVDMFESVTWASRVDECGDFELYGPVTMELLSSVTLGNYFFSETFYNPTTDTASLMFIETVTIESDSDNGKKLKVTGRDLKSILDRRIIWSQTSFKANEVRIDSVIETLVNDAIINPQDWSKTYQIGDTGSKTISIRGVDRKIDNFVFIKDENIEYPMLLEDAQFDMDSLYSAIEALCKNYQLQFYIDYNFSTNKFQLHVTKYKDRSYDQYRNAPIVFSSSYENLKGSNYIESISNEKTIGLIVGEGDEYNRMYNIVGEGTGLDRKELNINASDVSKTLEDGTKYPNEQYLSMLLDKGTKEMKNNAYIQTFEGSIETTKGFNYPKDFNIGDIVEIVNEYDISSKVLISEVVLNVSSNGQSVIPTFSVYTEDQEVNE